MKHFLFLIITLFTVSAFSQFVDDRITLIEDVQAKRTLLYVQNNTDDDLNVFLKVDGTGYRRSSDRPIIKDIPAGQKIKMITLIPLRGVEASYTHILIVNEEAQPLRVETFIDDPELADFTTLLDNDLVVFIKDDCPRCTQMTNILAAQHTPFKLINIDDRKRYYDALYVLLKLEQEEDYSVKMPIIRKRGEMVYPIWDVKKMAKDLGQEFKN